MPAAGFGAAEDASMREWEEEQRRRAALTPEERAAEEADYGGRPNENTVDQRQEALRFLGIEEDAGNGGKLRGQGYAYGSRVNDRGQLNRVGSEHPDRLFERLVREGKDPDQVIAAINAVAGNGDYSPPPSLRSKIEAEFESKGARERTEAATGRAADRLQGLGVLGGEEGEALKADPILYGDLSAYHIDPTIGQVSTADKESVDAQRRALADMEDTYQQGGFSDADLARRVVSNARTDQLARQQRDALLSRAELRGQRGGGMELASLYGSNAAATEAKALADAQMVADAGTRSETARRDAYDAAGGIRDFNQTISNTNAEILRNAHAANQGIDLTGMTSDTAERRNVRDINRDTAFRQGDTALQLGQLESGAASDVAGQAMDQERMAGEDRWREIGRNDETAAADREAFANLVGGSAETGVGAVETYYTSGAKGTDKMKSGSNRMMRGAT